MTCKQPSRRWWTGRPVPHHGHSIDAGHLRAEELVSVTPSVGLAADELTVLLHDGVGCLQVLLAGRCWADVAPVRCPRRSADDPKENARASSWFLRVPGRARHYRLF